MSAGEGSGIAGRPDAGGLRVRFCGDSAICIEFGNRVDADLHARVLALDRAIAARELPGVIEAVPTYRSLLVHIDPVRADHRDLADALCALAAQPAEREVPRERWWIPVVYGGAHGVDLAPLAAERGMTPKEFAESHAAAVYTVFMIGFMPGFTYLGGLDPRLSAPRHPEPRARVPAGSIAIGGMQTSIGTLPAPSGWHLIGQTPVRGFVPGRVPPFLFEAGQEVEFESIPEAEWESMDAAARAGERIAVRVES